MTCNFEVTHFVEFLHITKIYSQTNLTQFLNSPVSFALDYYTSIITSVIIN